MLSKINALYSCRESQTNQLYHCLRQCCQTLIVYGLRSTAKTSVVKALLDESNSFNAYLNINEFFSNKMLFQSVLNQLNDKINDCFQTKPFNSFHCNSFNDFIHSLKQILDQFVDHYNHNRRQLSQTMAFSQCIVVFDSIDSNHHLINANNKELMTTLTHLQELTENVCPISCVWITCQSIEWFCRITSSPMTAIQINFNNYSPQEMSLILSNDCPDGYDKGFYQNYINIIVKTVVQMTRNLSEIRSICLSKFGKYVEPMTTSEMTSSDSAKLFKRFQPTLIQIMDEIPLKESNKSIDCHEWPESMKYLLIACYLSSYTSTKNDKKVFVKNEGKRRERKRKFNTEDNDCVGPKASTFERIVHVYKAIIELNAENNGQYLNDMSNKLLSEFQELVSLKMIDKTFASNKNNFLSSLTKYKISNSVSQEFVKQLSFELNFNFKAFIE